MKYLICLSLTLLSLCIAAQDACPCCTEKHTQFDFWEGDWEAYVADTIVGYNNIVKMQDNCILQENWRSKAGSYTGTSYNSYNSQKKRWEQLWIDNQGGSLNLKGQRIDNQMILVSDPIFRNDTTSVTHRITWTANDNGSVRQHWEATKNFGQTWATLFDGLYKKRE